MLFSLCFVLLVARIVRGERLEPENNVYQDLEKSAHEPTPTPPVRYYLSPLGLFLPSIYQIPLKAYHVFPALSPPQKASSPSVVAEALQSQHAAAAAPSPMAPAKPTRHLSSFVQRFKPLKLDTNLMPATSQARSVPSERLVKRIIFTSPDLKETIDDLKLEA